MKILNLLALALLMPAGLAHAQEQPAVTPISWGSLNMAPLDTPGIKPLYRLIANSNRYALNTWYRDVKKFDSQTGDYLDFGRSTEHFVRPVSHQAFSLAVALRWGIYDEKATGVPAKTALERTLRMTSSLAFRHKANSPDGKGWGNAWQSALWASQTALAAWFLWDNLSERDREMVVKMLVYEADRFNQYKTPYYQNREGKIISKGDTKAEENAWNSNILVTACVMMPDHPHWQQWNDKAVELQVSAFSTPGDRKKTQVINGFQLSNLQGSNINPDGTLVNHHIIHPDYMSAIMHNVINGWVYALAGQPVPQASLHNGELIYQAMTTLPFKDGQTIYVREGGKPTSRMFYPEGNDWGDRRQANYWLLDIIADIYHWDGDDSIKARQWATEREKEMLGMQNRSKTGQYYQSRKEDIFNSREEWVSFHLAYGYLALWENANGMLRITAAPLKQASPVQHKRSAADQ